jgi:ATP-dependent DNA helicase PIF1
MIPSDMPFEFKRLQFPVRLAFAISINKAQGQSLKVAGISLEAPCFSHGQLYVACSRVGTGKNLFVFAPDGKTRNVVYQTALR